MESNIQKKSDKNQNAFTQQIINERYLQSIEHILRKYNFQIKHQSTQSKHLNEYNSEQFIDIKQPQQSKIQQNKFYFALLKKFYQLRKIINPQMKFQSFLALYNEELSQKFKKFKINDIFKSKKSSGLLNKLIMQNELAILKQQTFSLIQSKSAQIMALKKQSQKVNQQYQNLIQNLVQKPTFLNVQNLQLQVKIKLKQKQQKDSLTQTYSSRLQRKLKPSQKDFYPPKVQNKKVSQIKNNKKEQIQRIKAVIKNNMWGYGQQIKLRLQKLKALKEELKS